MKKSQVIALTALTTTLLCAATVATVCLVKKRKHNRRLSIVSDAGYETAYDVHYPLKYKR